MRTDHEETNRRFFEILRTCLQKPQTGRNSTPIFSRLLKLKNLRILSTERICVSYDSRKEQQLVI